MKRLSLVAAIGLIATFTLASCGSSEYTAEGGGDYVTELEAEGLRLMPAGVATIRQLTVTGQRYDIGRGGELHIYEYESESMASLDANKILGGIASNAHAYRSGNVLAVYFGNDLSAQTTLASVFGPQLF